MFYLYADGRLISQPPDETLIVLSPRLTLELGKAGSFEFSIPPTNMYYGEMRKLKTIITVNASGTDWWVSKEDYDIRPDQYAKHAFMSGFNDDFLSAIKPVRVTTALNTVDGYTETTVDTFDRFFLPSLEQMNVVPQLSGAEGEYWAYWRRRLGVSAPVAQYGTYPNLITTAINAKTSPQSVRLRSAYRGRSCYAWLVHASGYVSGLNASLALRFSPVCVVC